MVNPYQPNRVASALMPEPQFLRCVATASFLAAITTAGGYFFVAMRTAKNIDTTTQALRLDLMRRDTLSLGSWAIYFLALVCVLVFTMMLSSRPKNKEPVRIGFSFTLPEIFASFVVIIGVFASEPAVASILGALR